MEIWGKPLEGLNLITVLYLEDYCYTDDSDLRKALRRL